MFTVFFIIEGQNFFPFSIINKQSECAFYNSFNFAETDDPSLRLIYSDLWHPMIS